MDTLGPAFSPNEVFSGRHAIRVSRGVAHETDKTGDGVQSDYIKIIPGNFRLQFKIRLQDIVPNQLRLGTKMYDAINIQLTYFDKNKQELSPEVYWPENMIFIDNSFKGFPFSNFWSIDSLPWHTVVGRSHHYPFSPGDVPSAARYAKIFIGLKGKGTMWIDDIDFRYTRWNFSSLESVKPYMNRDLSPRDLVMPRPKEMKALDNLQYFCPDSSNFPFPVILVPAKASKEELLAASELRGHIMKLFQGLLPESNVNLEDIRISSVLKSQDAFSGGYFFSIGKSALYNMYKESLPVEKIQGKEQGYFLGYLEERPKTVFLYGNSPVANMYAVQTAIQLFAKDKFVYHNASVIDYPFMGTRSIMLGPHDIIELNGQDRGISIGHFLAFKFNQLDINYTGIANYRDTYKKDLYKLGQLKQARAGFDFGVCLPAYGAVNKRGDQETFLRVYNKGQAFYSLAAESKMALSQGAKTIILAPARRIFSKTPPVVDFSLHGGLNGKTIMNIQEAHAHLVNNLSTNALNRYPGSRLEFVPPWYNLEYVNRSRGHAEIYFKELLGMMDKSCRIAWSGAAPVSFILDDIDGSRFNEYVGGRAFYTDQWFTRPREDSCTINDHFHVSYPGKIRLGNLFQPYNKYFTGAFLESSRQGMRFCLPMGRESDKVRLATIAEFAWDPFAYDADKSLWKALVRFYGQETAQELMLFNDYLYELREIILAKKEFQVQKRFINRTGELRQKLEESYQRLEQTCDNQLLLMELKKYTGCY